MKKMDAKQITLAALAIAVVCVSTMVIQIPIPLGYMHLGNCCILLFGVFFIVLFTSRFLIEFVKNPQEEFEIGMTLNMGQWLSIPFILMGIGFVVYALSRPPVKLAFPNRFADDPENQKSDGTGYKGGKK